MSTGQRWTVGTVSHSQTLQPGESYTSMMTRSLPDVVDGDYRLVIVTDYNNRIFEGPYEGNNGLTGGVISMTHPDIEVRNLDAPASANSGQTITVTWDFLNSGSATADEWQQSIYLSDNQTLVRRRSLDRSIRGVHAARPHRRPARSLVTFRYRSISKATYSCSLSTTPPAIWANCPPVNRITSPPS